MTKSNEMTPEQKIKWLIIERVRDEMDWVHGIDPVTQTNVDEIFDEMNNSEDCESSIQDAIYWTVREGTVETNIPSPDSRHYESKSVAAKMPDGSWVGWTYWYGGGKHGCPEEIDWMDEAYNLDCLEEQKLVTVQTFTKVK